MDLGDFATRSTTKMPSFASPIIVSILVVHELNYSHPLSLAPYKNGGRDAKAGYKRAVCKSIEHKQCWLDGGALHH